MDEEEESRYVRKLRGLDVFRDSTLGCVVLFGTLAVLGVLTFVGGGGLLWAAWKAVFR